jgi:chromosomal replication initiation ATPase DnaA
MYIESETIGYNPDFLRRVRDKRLAREAEAAKAADREKALRTLHRIDELRMEADRARKEALARKAARDEAEREQREAEQMAALSGAVTELQWLIAKAMLLFDVTKHELKGGGRNGHVVFARQFIMYWARRRTGFSLPQIGRHLGGRDHTTCLHGQRAYVKKRAKQGRTLRPAR